MPFLQEKWQYWQKFWHSILKKFFWQNCEKSKNWFLTLFPLTPTKIKLHKRTVCQMKGNFMYFVTYFMQSTRKTNIMSSRTQNMCLKFIASPFIVEAVWWWDFWGNCLKFGLCSLKGEFEGKFYQIVSNLDFLAS